MSFETEQKLRTMRKWLAYSEVDFGNMDSQHRDEYLHDGLKMAIEVVKSLHLDSMKYRARMDASSPLFVQ